MADVTVSEPFPIFKVSDRYLLYDVNTITYIRREYHIIGTLVGGLPQAPQQNVFLGIPLQLMPEEARLLVEKGAAHIVDDAEEHKRAYLQGGLSEEEQKAFRASMDKMGLDAAKLQTRKAEERKETALKKIADKENGRSKTAAASGDWNDIPDDMLAPRGGSSRNSSRARKGRAGGRTPTTGHSPSPSGLRPPMNEEGSDQAPMTHLATNGTAEPSADPEHADQEEELLFASTRAPKTDKRSASLAPSEASTLRAIEPHKITPTTSYPPMSLAPPTPADQTKLPDVPDSYPLYRHMHEKDHFLAPGLRFGCQYTAYPGDPLRFHSHFLCSGMDWDKDFDLLDLVGGGRLGTGVKKGFLIGGAEKADGEVSLRDVHRARDGEASKAERHNKDIDGDVRVFCVEWGGM